MVLSINPIHSTPIAFKAREDEKRKISQSDVATATGATGAAAAGAKGGGFKMFNSSSKVGKMTQSTAQALQNARKPIKQVKGLFPKFMQAFRNTKADILKWADGVKNSSMLKPLLKSKAFNACAGALGALMGFFVVVTGLGDIVNTISDYTNG